MTRRIVKTKRASIHPRRVGDKAIIQQAGESGPRKLSLEEFQTAVRLVFGRDVDWTPPLNDESFDALMSYEEAFSAANRYHAQPVGVRDCIWAELAGYPVRSTHACSRETDPRRLLLNDVVFLVVSLLLLDRSHEDTARVLEIPDEAVSDFVFALNRLRPHLEKAIDRHKAEWNVPREEAPR